MSMEARYRRDIPVWLRLIGCWAIETSCGRNTYRFNWGEFSWRWGITLTYSVYHEEAHICFQPAVFQLFINVPMVINQREGTEDWSARYGITSCDRSIQLCWRDKCKIIHMPWDYEWLWNEILDEDGYVYYLRARGHRQHYQAYSVEEKAKEMVAKKFPYLYTLKSGEMQVRTATVHIEKWAWGLRWFRFPVKVRKSISVAFSDEVGERSGTWKGGTIGCGYEMLKGESMHGALRRMERDRKF